MISIWIPSLGSFEGWQRLELISPAIVYQREKEMSISEEIGAHSRQIFEDTIER
jgi:hypothetical protein